MKLRNLTVRNFRGLRSVSIPNPSNINIIVGPNAIGKSTLLEAIRLPKVILSPRVNGEGTAALTQMGVISPHQAVIGSNGVDIGSLAFDPQESILLGYDLHLNETELKRLEGKSQDLAFILLRSESAQETAEAPLAFTQFLSTEDGRKKLQERKDAAERDIKKLSINPILNIQLTMNGIQSSISGGSVFNQAVLSILDRQVASHKSLFSAFPADRSFPVGEQPIQVGSGDAQQQLLSHMATPGSKYARLKQTIVQYIMFREDGRKTIEKEFNQIFENLLPGKRLHGIQLNDIGLMKVLVQDIDNGKIYDIDQMSSGEKGLLLTFMFLRLSMERGGIFMLDEPELHLNAAVSSRIMGYIKQYCIDDLDLQGFICTHSPELVRDSYDNTSCSLYHLRASDDLTPILSQDQGPLFEIFERLGSSTAEVLFSKGNIYVEGPDDTQILQAGFPQVVNGFKITPVGGRGDIVREVPVLLKEEKDGRLKKKTLFILDNDRDETTLKSGNMVRVHQLKRYCIENYLIDADLLYDLISIHAKHKENLPSRGSFPNALETLALSQASEIAMKEVYVSMSPESPGMRVEDYEGKTFEDTADTLITRLERVKSEISNFDPVVWKADFIDKSKQNKAELEISWKAKWTDLCSGKRLIDDLYKKYEIAFPKKEFKKSIIRSMSQGKTDDWRIINDILLGELK